jgi:hypothetical protein
MRCAGERLGRSTPKISKYLMSVKPFVQKLEEHLRPYFGNKSPSEELESVKSDLDDTDALQETARAGLPEETAKRHLAAKELLDMIEEVNRIAKIAFDGKAEIAAQLNKDLTLRAKKSGKKVAGEESGETAKE